MEYIGQVFDHLSSPGEDALTLWGPEPTLVDSCVFDFSQIPLKDQDEQIDGVRGAQVHLKNSLLLLGKKAILAGNGDYPEEDKAHASWIIENCLIWGAGRRCPDAQDGTQVVMRNCWIHGWGQAFDVRAFGAWARTGARITVENCIFTQNLTVSPVKMILDLIGHIGQYYNDYGISGLLKPKAYLPGICRGLMADTGGTVSALSCFTNKPWILLENRQKDMTEYEARDLIKYLEPIIPEVEKRIGLPLCDLFELVLKT